MIDGIIQQAFRRYEQDVNCTFEQFKQELIEKIKQESYHIEMHGIGYDAIQLIKLIGDNKE